ncbi:glycerate kinase type-2 family protein [Cupriavidus sp. D39]|uniref:glycerate kinase type-2 family protein n=1 Tax=Cupriavidus sp. D39 TaxID=2997877 RepID=UPI00226F8B69|nr:glycerate kinase [Cupriavidus sp. D39]MCY0856333.1 glycerate kinase [Cupriavidus sp. D39]
MKHAIIENPKAFLESLFRTAVSAADPQDCLACALPEPPVGRTIVVGAGKAAASMARALERAWPGPLAGLVVTRYGHAAPTSRIEVVEAAHPVPDAAGQRAAVRMLDMISGLSEDDLVICLISGGGSSLLSLPLAGISLDEKRAVNQALLASGATISEMNCVRRHLSSIKGGRLAAACHPARVVTLLISDVPGDDPANIASGPTVCDATTCQDALDIVRRYGILLPASAERLLVSGGGESIKPGDERLAHSEVHMIATPAISLAAAAQAAAAAGIRPYVLGDRIEGEAADVGKVMAGIAFQAAQGTAPFQLPCVLLSGGETTVTVKGNGRGGRNVEFLLSLAIALDGHPGVFALAADTDGVDGIEEIAGAYADPTTLSRAWQAEMAPHAFLSNNDGHTFFEALGDAIVTGPTLTNVNDFRAMLITSPAGKGC